MYTPTYYEYICTNIPELLLLLLPPAFEYVLFFECKYLQEYTHTHTHARTHAHAHAHADARTNSRQENIMALHACEGHLLPALFVAVVAV